MAVRLSGRLTVDFHADPATCASVGLCGISGRTTWTPARSGELDARRSGRGKSTDYLGALVLQSEREPATVTRTVVQRVAPDGSRHGCADVVKEARPVFWTWSAVRGRLPLALATKDNSTAFLMRTRCAGPIDADVERLLTQRAVRGSTVMGGRLIVNLSGNQDFAAKGLAGTVRSSVILRLGRAHKAVGDDSGGGRQKYRVISVAYMLTKLEGGFGVAFSGSVEPGACSAFDTCGASGGVDVTPGKSDGFGGLTAIAPANRPRQDLLAALGLSKTGNPEGVEASGSVVWDSPDGVAVTHLGHGDGGAECRDRIPSPGGLVTIGFVRGVAQVGVTSEDLGLDSLRSRCAGPLIGDAEASVATASVPAETFDQDTVVLDLSRGTTLSRGPFSGASTSTLKVTLTRLGPPQETVTKLKR